MTNSLKTTIEELFFVIYLVILAFVEGCGVLPLQQGRTLNFEVSGFKLPAAMVHTADRSAPSKVPTISTNEQQAVTFVQNIVMQSVEDVLYQQGLGSGLSSDVISSILNQLNVTVKYEPLKCDIVFTDADGNGVVKQTMTNCQIISGTVTKMCTMPMMNQQVGAAQPPPPPTFKCTMLEEIKPMHLTITGSITTTNIIMANWSTEMWQSVLNRALRSLTSGPLGSQFITASISLK